MIIDRLGSWAAGWRRPAWLGVLAVLLVAASPGVVRAGGEPPDYVGAFDLAFQPGWSVPLDDALPNRPAQFVDLRFRIFEAGQLRLPSGRIKACDPFVGMDHPAFTAAVPKGTFPVRLALVDGTSSSNGRVAFARVQFSSAPVVRWAMAVRAGQNPATLKPGERFGYPVDAGTGSFVDAQAAIAAAKKMEADESWSEGWIDAGEINPRPKGAPRFYLEVGIGAGNIIMFESGWGDGVYASWFGYDAGGNVAALVTDFDVIDWSKVKW